MKKLMFLMMALMVAPAMADVVFSVVDNADHTADIMVEFTDADTVGGGNVKSLIAGIALNVSVSTGNIVAVTNYKGDDFPTTPAVSTNASPGYGIHMSTMTFSGDPYEIATAGTPQAPYDSPTGPSIVLPASDIVLEHGALFDVGVPADAPLAGLQRLCTIEVSEEGATLTITGGNATRGSVVRLGGGVPTTIDYGTGTLVTGFDCYTGPDFTEWVGVGKPDSWCEPHQCHGDADGLDNTYGTPPPPVLPWTSSWVTVQDTAILISGYKQIYSGDPDVDGPDIGSAPDTWISADFNHAENTYGTPPPPVLPWTSARVTVEDTQILIAWYKNPSVPSDCLTGSPVVP